MRGCFGQSRDVTRKTFWWCLAGRAPCHGCAGLEQCPRRRTLRPTRRVPQFSFIQGKPNGPVDHDTSVAHHSRPPRPQFKTRRVAEISNQRERTIANFRFADTDELVARPEIEIAFENGFDSRHREALTKLVYQNA